MNEAIEASIIYRNWPLGIATCDIFLNCKNMCCHEYAMLHTFTRSAIITVNNYTNFHNDTILSC